VLPLNTINPAVSVSERDSLVLQSLISLILITEMLPSEKLKTNIPLRWLKSKQYIGDGLTKLGLTLAAIPSKSENDVFKLISSRSITLVNTLIQKSFDYINHHNGSFKELATVKLHLPSHTVIGALLASLDHNTLNPILQLHEHLKKVDQSIIEIH
jgi:hypothetical protein